MSYVSPNMARPAPRRPSTLNPNPRPTITLEEWEARAPLSDVESHSVNVLKAAGSNNPLPLKFEEPGPSRPATPSRKLGSRPSTPVHSLHPKDPVHTPQQFYDWFALIDRSVAHSQESHFRAHVANVADRLESCDALIGRIDEIDTEVDDMFQGWTGVEESGKNLKEACERLLEERDRLLELTQDIGNRLEYFQELEHATRMLNHPGESLVLQTDFLYMVERVDICIDYLKSHRHYREAEIYLMRFHQCMTRAMTLIKMYFVGSLRALTADVSERLYGKDVSQTAQMHLLYTRFKTVSAQLAPLLGELERRAQAHPDELSALLYECHTAYFGARRSLLVGRLMEEIKGLDPTRTELVELTRAGCSYLKQLCTDEFHLYLEFFGTGEEQLYAYLETLCDYLYDDLRPRILHEPRLTSLCEVCTVLQALMVLDISSIGDDGDDDEEEEGELRLTTDLDHPRRKGLGKLHISHLLQMVLQDAQTRLFFKAQSVIQSEIRYFVPKQEDLAYPDKLVAARVPGSSYDIKEKESVSQIFQLPSLDKQDTWFPTLRKTVWVLSQLHNFVKPAIFEDIAQEAVSLCRQSLVSSGELVKQRSSPLDGQLFLVRHLLILKEMAQNLDLVQRDIEPNIDFGSVTETLASMLSKTTSMLPDALFASLGMPRTAEETIVEAKQGIDHELKVVCEAVISQCADPICSPLQAWVVRIRMHSESRSSTSLPQMPSDSSLEWAGQTAAESLDIEFRLACQRDLRGSVARLRLYLEDNRTVEVLVKHVQETIADEYASYREVVMNLFTGALRGSVLSPVELREFLSEICGEGEEARGNGASSSRK